MKVYIGPYKNWFGPYQLAEALCFWAGKGKYGQTKKWVHDFGEFLAHGKVYKEKRSSLTKDENKTLLYKFLSWIDSKRKRTIKVRIDPYDVWSMDTTLAYIILPMLKQLKTIKHGAPHVDNDDVPEELRGSGDPMDADENYFKRWDWVMDEMIFAFENQLDENWEDEFHTGEADYIFVPCEDNPEFTRMEEGPNHTYKCDYDGMKKIEDRRQNGFRLFGKYYQGLWD